MNVTFRPMMSVSLPPSSSRLPNASAYAVTTHCRSILEKCRACCAEGRAMFTIVASSAPAFDPLIALDDLLTTADLVREAAGGAVSIAGQDPIVPSVHRLGACIGIPVMAAAVAAVAFHRHRGGPGQDLELDLRQATQPWPAATTSTVSASRTPTTPPGGLGRNTAPDLSVRSHPACHHGISARQSSPR